MNPDSSSLYLKVLKSWITPETTLVLQVQLAARRDEGLPKKFHLLIDMRQQSFGLSFQQEKPAGASSQHAVVEIIRKHCPVFGIRAIYYEPATQSYYLPLATPGPETKSPFGLHLKASKPPLLSFVNPEAVVLVSFGQRGTFTKKHDFSDEDYLQDVKDVLPTLIQEWSESLPGKREETLERQDPVLEGEKSEEQKALLHRLRRKRKTLKKSLEKVLAEIPSSASLQQTEREAHLLRSFAYRYKPDMISLSLSPEETGLETEIHLTVEPDQSIGHQVEQLFIRLRKAKRAFDLGEKQRQKLASALHSLEEDILQLEQSNALRSDLEMIRHRHEIKEESAKSSQITASAPTHQTYRRYLASSGQDILVGKGSIDNDALTKSARGNDYWLHAAGVTGSHVIVPMRGQGKGELPPATLKEAAILALFYSKFKADFGGECYVTRKQHLKKPKGMPAGLWRIDQSETLFFRYTEEELQAILARKV